MRRRLAIGGAGVVALGAALLLGGRSPEERAPPVPAQGPAPSRPVERAPAAARPLRPLPEPTLAPQGAVRGERLAKLAGPGSRDSAASRLLASSSPDELALFARLERLTGRADSPALAALLERRRSGASADELVALATRLLAGDPLGRAAALEWIRETRDR